MSGRELATTATPPPLDDDAQRTPSPKRYNPVLFSRTDTQDIPKLLQRESVAEALIHNVDSARRTAALHRAGDEGEGSDGGEPRRRARASCWARCCVGCGRRRDEDGFYAEAPDGDEDENRSGVMRQAASQVRHLPPLPPHLKGKKTLVLDLDETLVHSSFKEVPGYVQTCAPRLFIARARTHTRSSGRRGR